MKMQLTRRLTHGLQLGVLCAVAFPACLSEAREGEKGRPARQYRGVLGADSKKIKRDGNRTLLWAGGPLAPAPENAESHWYDFTDAALPVAELQFGIGKDRIRSIDDPVFVPPDDPRLMEIAESRYRPDENPKHNDDIRVIGYVVGEEARAYPVALLDHHELVNDRVGGKPVTVGW